LNSHLLPLFISYRGGREKLIKYQANSSCVSMSLILMTTLFYKALILQGQIWCWSHWRFKGLRQDRLLTVPYFFFFFSRSSALRYELSSCMSVKTKSRRPLLTVRRAISRRSHGKIWDCEQSKDKIASFFAILSETRDLSRGDFRGRCTPHPEMTYGSLIQVMFCKNENMRFIGVEVKHEMRRTWRIYV